MDDDEDDWADESGHFCRHWSELGTCEARCGDCGHSCGSHDAYDKREACEVMGCRCRGWIEWEEPKPASLWHRCNSNPVGPTAQHLRDIQLLHATIEERSSADNRMIVAMRDQLLRATRERRALLKVIHATTKSAVAKAKRELKKEYPRWEGWG